MSSPTFTPAPQPGAAAGATAITMANSQQMFVMNAFRGQPYLVDQLDVQDEPLYDTLTFNPGDTITVNTAQWFTSVGPQSNKSLVQTNLTETRHLVAPEAFSVFGIRLLPNENILGSDWENILQGFIFQFWFNSKAFNTGGIRHYAAGMGTYAVTTRTAESWYSNGFPSLSSGHLLQLPLVITNLLSFYAALFGNNYQLNAAGTGLVFICELVGLHARAVM
jgi:hypothetical protein